MTRLRIVGTVTGAVVGADALSKWGVRRSFELGESMPVAGDLLRLTYVLNPGAAFGITVGPYSREILGMLALAATFVIVSLIRHTPSTDRARLAALALILGGALGNLVDRFRSPGGVVDFLDVGVGTFRWPVFNLADVGVTTGATLLILLLWAEGEPEPARAGDGGTSASETAETG